MAQEIVVNWQIQAIDNASKALKEVEKSSNALTVSQNKLIDTTKKLNTETSNYEKAVNDSAKATYSLLDPIGTLKTVFSQLISVATKVGLVLGGIAVITPLYKATTIAVQGLDNTIFKLISGFNAASSAAKDLNTNLTFIQKIGFQLSKLPKIFVNPLFAGLANLRNIFTSFNKVLAVTRGSLLSTFQNIKNGTSITVGLASAFSGAVKQTELFSKGILGIVSRAAVLSVSFVGLSRVLLDSDSIISRLSGVTLVSLAIAFGGLTVVAKTFFDVVGGVIKRVGTGLVSASQKAADTFVQFESSAFAFNRTLEKFNEEFGDTIGTTESWNKTLQDLRATTSVSTRQLQLMATEVIEVGSRLGFTEEQLKNIINVSIDYAKANKRDVIDSLNAVIGGLNGMGQGARNMGIFLDDATVAQINFGKETSRNISGLNIVEKAQLRYNALLKQYHPIAGLASAAGATLAERQKLLKAAFTDFNAVLGKGAEIIEQQLNRPLEFLVKIFRQLPDGLVSTAGFFQALIGRLLQFIGIVLQSIFTVGLLLSTFKGLNALLASASVQRAFAAQLPLINKSIIDIIASLGIANTRIKSLADVARIAFQGALISIKSAVAGLLGLETAAQLTARTFITSLGTRAVQALVLLRNGILAASKAFLAFLANPVVLIITAIVGAIYLLFRALEVIEEKTGFFAGIWRGLSKSLKETTEIMEKVTKAFKDFLSLLSSRFLVGINYIAIGILRIVLATLQAFDYVRDKISDFISFIGRGVNAIKGFLAKLNIISVAEASELDENTRKFKEQEEASSNTLKSQEKIRGIIKKIGTDIDNILSGKDLEDQAQKPGRALATSLIQAIETAKEAFRKTDLGKSIKEQGVATVAVQLLGAGAGGAKKLTDTVLDAAGAGIGAAFGSSQAGQAIAETVKLLSLPQDEFKALISEFFDTLIEIPQRIAENLPFLIDKLVERLPEIIDAFNQLLPEVIANLQVLLVDPNFWLRVGQAQVKALFQPVADVVNGFKISVSSFNTIIDNLRSFPEVLNSEIDQIVNKLNDVFDPFIDALNSIIDGIKSINIPGIGSLVGGGLFGSIGGAVGGAIGSIGGSFGFANGGDVPDLPRYSNDRFPARLSAGEAVLTKTTSDRLNQFLDTQAGGGRPQTISINLQVGEKNLADVLLSLNEQGIRIA